DGDEVVRCPYCAEYILAVAKKCKHCGEPIGATRSDDAAGAGRRNKKGRTESIAFQVHPDDEQDVIDTMQCFGWNLLGTQEVKTVDNSLEVRGNTVYNVRTTERYVKLSFS